MKKLSQASEVEKIQALAELDEWTGVQQSCIPRGVMMGLPPKCERYERCKEYLTSYDAIIPMIQNEDCFNEPLHLTEGQKEENLSFRVNFLNALRKLLQVQLNQNAISDFDMLVATPLQLSDALLIATGKFEL